METVNRDEIKVRVSEVRKAYADMRRYAAEAVTWLDNGSMLRAYRAAESAQSAAFDAKALIEDGGKYDAKSNEPIVDFYPTDPVHYHIEAPEIACVEAHT